MLTFMLSICQVTIMTIMTIITIITTIVVMMFMGMMTIISSIHIRQISFSSSWTEPSEIFLILDWNITVFNDTHEDILHDRNKEKQESVHEK